MITKKIKRDNLVTGIAEAVVCGVLTEILFVAVILATGSWSRLTQSLLVTLCITLVYVIIGWIRALTKNHAFMKKVRNQNADVSLDEDSYEPISGHVSLGRNWLVYHRGNQVIPVSIQSVESVRTDGKHAILYDAEGKPVFTLKYSHREEGLPNRIREWIHVNKNSEYK